MVEKDKKDIIAKLKEMTQDSSMQNNRHTEAKMNKEFIKGNQWIYLDAYDDIQEYEQDKEYYRVHRRYRPREVINIITPIWSTYKAYLIRTTPRIVAKPEDPDEVFDILGARVATKLMEHFYEALIIREMKDDIFDYMLIFGTAIVHPFYNTVTKVNDMKVLPPSQFFPYPIGETKWRNLLGGCWQRSVPVKTMNALYPNKEFSEDRKETHLMPLEYRHSTDAPGVTLYDYWELPSKKSDGMFVCLANGQILEYFNYFPYKNQDFKKEYKLPFIPAFDKKTSDDLFGFSTIELIRSRQTSLNKAKSVLTELREQKSKLCMDVNSKQKMEDMVDPNSSVLEWEGGPGVEKPFWTSPAQVSPGLYADVERIAGEMEHTAGLHEITLRAMPPGSIQSGVGVQSLRETDELRLTPALESLRICLIKSFEQLYALTRQYYSSSMVKRILGEMGEIDIITFKNVNLSPMTFTIRESSFSPFAEAARIERITRLLNMGLIDVKDPHTRLKILRYVEPEFAGEIDPITREEQLQKWENTQMLKGENVIPNPDDMDEVHLDTINVIIKSINFSKLDGDIRENFLRHKEYHQRQLKDKVMQASQMAQGMTEQGGGGPQSQQAPPQPESVAPPGEMFTKGM